MADDELQADAQPRPPHWQVAKRRGAELPLDLPDAAPGTHVYIATDGLDHPTLVLLRASVRALERTGVKVKLL